MEWYNQNMGDILTKSQEYSQRYRNKHPDRVHNATRAWKAKNKQRVTTTARQWRLDHPENVRRHEQNKKRKYPEAVMLSQAKQRAKKKGLICTLVLSDIPAMPEFCPVFPWIRLERHIGTGLHENAPSLDRIHNDQGYVPSNVRIISDRANRCKRDMGVKEIQALWEDMCQN